MPLRRQYVKAVLLSPYIGSLLLCGLGLAGAGLWVMRYGTPAPVQRTLVQMGTQMGLKVNVVQPLTAPVVKASSMPRPVAKLTRVAKPEQPQFHSPISEDELRMLREDVGQTSGQLMRDERVLRVVDEVVPYEPIHIGLDEPLTQALEATLRRSVLPVTLRDDRYLMFSKIRETVPSSTPQTGRGRGFLWVDLKTGMAIGGIYFYPTNGEPTPTLTLFSKQVGDRAAGIRELPAEFREDLKAWGETWKMPALVTQYFIHSEGRKTVLVHDAPCDASLAAEDCAKQRTVAVEIDEKAAEYVGRVHYASNATGHTVFAAN